ncbi:helix-hairpin-helix domain-containing protein [Methanolobus bombayensis]|uniref:helix-hairpin-helix domain-containing protein n=1 Tax=Methanolobus bombayensis TaxID=38023 RepID=UPI001AE70D2F|nr:helix-hairpin-helix domain-containing protein [Methanolobus bombayensis]MBP1909627.1 hypothetical protein [Methanolobus bombayensis]
MKSKKNEKLKPVSENYKVVTKELMIIPGVGKKIADDLWNLEIRSVSELKDKDPEKLYQQLCDFQGMHVDRCILYVFRCAIYFASNDEHDPELLKWWNWKD